MSRLAAAAAGLAVVGSLTFGAAPASAVCTVTLDNAPAGRRRSCSEYGFGYVVTAVTGVAGFDVYCDGAIIATGSIGPGLPFFGSTRGSTGCNATLVLTAWTNGTTAYGVMD